MRLLPNPFLRLNSLKYRSFFALTLISTLLISFFSCTEVPVPTATPVKFEPTPAVKGSRISENANSSTSKSVDLSGDSFSGETLFTNLGCNACHSLGDDKLVGPGFLGIYERAGSRTSLSNDDYIIQSIKYPGEYLVEGFENLMPATFVDLSDSDLNDLIAYLKTIK